MKLKIIKFPNPILRQKAKPVKKVTPGISKLIADMIETMHAAPGVGLAAPQVNKSLQVIVIDIGEGAIGLVNPQILERSGQQVFTEGCLCLPGVEAPVERASFVKVAALNAQGEKGVIEAQGFLATVLQHEIDHLDGKVFIDRVNDPSLIKYVPRSKEKREEMI
jgi:peptide deformylase